MPTFEPSIEHSTISDIPELVQLVNSAYRGDSSRIGWTTEADYLDGIRIDEEALRSILEAPGSTILKYTQNGAIKACVHLQNQGAELYLGMLTVHPELQGAGIGKTLLKASEKFGRQQGCESIVMTVISIRDELIAWYVRHGFKRTGQKLPFPNDPRYGIPKQALEFDVLKKEIL